MPLMVIEPAVGCSRSAMTRSSVVLPQPDGPMKETNSPCPISRLTSLSATTSPSLVWKVRPRCCAETTELRSHPRRRDAGALDLARGGDFFPLAEGAVDRVGRLARDELAVARLSAHLVLGDRDLAAAKREARQAGDLETLEHIVVDDGLLGLGAD